MTKGLLEVSLLAWGLAALSGGCSCSTPLETLDGGVDGASALDASAAADARDAAPSDAGASDADAAGCVEANVQTWALDRYDDVSVRYRARLRPDVGGAPLDLYLEFVRYDGVTYVGAHPLGVAPDDDFATCAHCVSAFTGSMFDRGYFATTGSLVTHADPFDLTLDMTLDEVTLREVTIESDGSSRRVLDGACIHLTHAEADVAFEPPGWTCLGAAYDDGTVCHCECGILDPDCLDPTLPIDGCAVGQRCVPIPRGVIGPFFGDGECRNDCDRATGAPCPPAEACVDNYYGDVCSGDPAELDRIAVIGGLCVEGALHCAIDGAGFANGYCDRYDHADRRCRPRCSADTDCVGGERCYVVGSDASGPEEIPFGFCSPRHPPEWTCTPAAWEDGATCDCACGAVDPDCLDGALPVSGCAVGESCRRGVCS